MTVPFLRSVIVQDFKDAFFVEAFAKKRAVGRNGKGAKILGIFHVRIFGDGIGKIFCQMFFRVSLGENNVARSDGKAFKGV